MPGPRGLTAGDGGEEGPDIATGDGDVVKDLRRQLSIVGGGHRTVRGA